MKLLKQQAYEANISLPEHGLVTLTWGNVSVFDRARGLVAIKPSGVAYAALSPESMVVLDLDGAVVDGACRPSSDTATHLVLYRAFPQLGGIAHTHSRWATIWSQMARPIPALGTTHADYFSGDVPCTRMLTGDEVETAYEKATGAVIVETLAGIDPLHAPAALVAGPGPFSWGEDGGKAVENAVVLEEVAMMAWHTLALNPDSAVPQYLVDKHFSRKHGKNAYYGQG